MKPKWLKKLHKNKPWKYPRHFDGIGIIEVYNFSTPIGFDVYEIDKAIEWIDKNDK